MRLNHSIPRRDFLQLSAGAFAYSGLAQKFIDARDTGARGDGRTLNTNALQKAIDQVAAAGGGVVVLPPGDFLSGGLTEDPYGGPCKACWAEVDRRERARDEEPERCAWCQRGGELDSFGGMLFCDEDCAGAYREEWGDSD